jgi:hypothetical protein
VVDGASATYRNVVDGPFTRKSVVNGPSTTFTGGINFRYQRDIPDEELQIRRSQLDPRRGHIAANDSQF